MNITQRAFKSVLSNTLRHYPNAIKALLFSTVAFIFFNGLNVDPSSLDDEIPIRSAVNSTAEVPVVNPQKITAADGRQQIQRVVTQRSVVTVKNKVSYVPSLSDPAVEKLVYTYFSDIPELIYVAKCESTFRHYGPDGKPLRGSAVNSDVGVMQINEFFHDARARSLGLDIRVLYDNLRYARLLYEEEGLQPWNASRPCWSKKHALARL
jgi:hypothetical protein